MPPCVSSIHPWGFVSGDTAQGYRNETEAGVALRESGLAREEVFITTKFSGGGDIPTAIQTSLKNVRSSSFGQEEFG